MNLRKDTSAYTELQVTSNFSFLRGASHAEELVLTAAALGHRAIGITDRNTLAGVVRAHLAARNSGVLGGIQVLIGARLDLGMNEARDTPELSLLCYPSDRAAYGRLSQLITLGRRRAPKGECWFSLDDVFAHEAGQVFILIAPQDPVLDADFIARAEQLAGRWRGRVYLAASKLYRGDDDKRLALLAALSQRLRLPLIAVNDVHYHIPARRMLQDVMTCIREHCSLQTAGALLAASAERHLKTPAEMTRLFAAYPEAIANSGRLAARLNFSLDELVYEYPIDPTPQGLSPQQELERLTWIGARDRYGDEIPDKVTVQLRHELRLIGELAYAPYFLTVHDIVRFARSQAILCQGRGSAANSAVCFCLGITAVDPARLDLLFERFISAERNEPPDIDVDFEHERREEVIQYIYEKYGRERAGIAATVITYRAKSAIREVGKALGLSLDMVGLLASNIWGWHASDTGAGRLGELGLDPDEPMLAMAIRLAGELIGFPRHLSQHVGGFIITQGPLSALAPIANAAMADRTFIEWDKDDLDALGILKIDVLSLGMLTCIRKCFDLIAEHYHVRYDLATVPAEDEAVYDMLCLGDSVGVFQVESRAQMTMLPRLRPRDFYDLVIEVAIVRPGPIQGDMVHPYLRRRSGEELVEFPSEELRNVLGKTLGIPLFQEQAMQIAIVAAGFTPSQADQLRRAMATFRRTGTIHSFETKMIEGMVERGYERDFAERCFRQIEGFGEYGFPESHAASFALLVYVSAWLKCHYPEVFACGLLNSQPMGFYAPAQIIRDAREHGVTVRPADVNLSAWDNLLQPVGGDAGAGTDGAPVEGTAAETAEGNYALRIGLRQIKGFKEAAAESLLAARATGYDSPEALWRRADLDGGQLEKLADADCWRSSGLDRRQALWRLKALKAPPLPLFAAAEVRPPSPNAPKEPPARLPEMPLGEHVVHDYVSLRLSLKAHPLELLRPQLTARRIMPNKKLSTTRDGARVAVAGLVIVRQRPGTAKGVIFITMEDESGVANVVVWKDTFEKFRRAVLGARLLAVRGKIQKEGLVIHVMAEEIIDLSADLDSLASIDSGPVPTAEAPASRIKAAAKHFMSGHPGARRHPRNINPIPEVIPPTTPSTTAPRIKPKSRDFH